MTNKKENRNWLITIALCCLATCVLGATAALAQGPGVLDKGTVSKVKIAVWDPESRDELAEMGSGDTLGLDPGDKVMLRLFVPRGHGPGNQRYYLPAKFTLASGGGAELMDHNTAKGSCVLEASTVKRAAVIRYELIGRGIKTTKPYLSRGSFRVEVSAPAAVPPPLADPAKVDAEKLVGRLYQGILLREHNKDNPAGRKWVEMVQKQGYPGTVGAAYEIVASDESQLKVSARGHTHQERLVSIYKHLLDVEGAKIDRYQWNDHLEMMVAGRVTEVVMDVVRSPEFRRVHGLTQPTFFRPAGSRVRHQ